jgi:hypothetical protein
MIAHDDNNDVIVTYPRMAEFAVSEGFPLALSTLQKRGSPSVATGPELIGYFGLRPATTKGLLRKWLRSELRSSKPAMRRRRQVASEPAPESPA